MTDSSISYDELISVLQKLKLELKKYTIQYEKLLLDFVSLNPDFSQLSFQNALRLLPIGWKIKNLTRLREQDSTKFSLQYTKLKEYFCLCELYRSWNILFSALKYFYKFVGTISSNLYLHRFNTKWCR